MGSTGTLSAMTTLRTAPLTVVGAGYVGLVTAVGLARLGHDGPTSSRPARPVSRMLRDGRIPIHEAGLQDAFDAAIADGRLMVTDEMAAEPDAPLICVGTPIGDDGASDLRSSTRR